MWMPCVNFVLKVGLRILAKKDRSLDFVFGAFSRLDVEAQAHKIVTEYRQRLITSQAFVELRRADLLGVLRKHIHYVGDEARRRLGARECREANLQRTTPSAGTSLVDPNAASALRPQPVLCNER